MADEKPFELSLELGDGECRVLVNGLSLNISLKPPKGGAPAAALAPQLVAPAPQMAQGNGAENQRLVEDLDYYRQISLNIYEELGQLAKKLNISLQDLTLAEVIRSQMETPGEQLDQARIQLNDVLEMTEKATLNILDLVEQIREDCEAVRQQLISLGPEEENGEAEPPAHRKPGLIIYGEEAQALFTALVAQAQELNQQFQAPALAEPPAPAEPQAPAEPPAPEGGGLHFPLAEILQIVLEFCGNEALKQHLKAVIAKQGEIFRTQEAEAAFVKLAASRPEEDGFSQFPVEEVLKILHSTCEDNRFQELFTKISASAGKLFPMPMLPLEGHPVDAAPAAAAAPAPATAPPAPQAAPQAPAFLPLWENFFQKLQQLAAQAETTPEVPEAAAPGKVPVEEAKIQESIGVLDRITTSLSRIMEALAFQDLSGQRLLQVLKLLRQMQFQILTLVVSAGTKLKKKAEQRGITLEESGVLAQDEIERLLSALAPTASSSEAPEAVGATQVLDQEAINDLLTNMGF